MGHPRRAPVLKVARGSSNWVITPLFIAILMVGVPPLVAPGWAGGSALVTLSSVPFFLFLLLWFFFRDPERNVGTFVVSPADGKVLRMDTIDDPDLGRCDRISIFMGLGDVHINRIPLDADVRRVTHRPGKHIPAFNKDSDRNERVETLLASDHGGVKVIQIAGAVARRIVPYIEQGDHLHKGERMGLIRLGSRCDLLFPEGTVQWTVEAKQKVRAGVSTVAKWKEGAK